MGQVCGIWGDTNGGERDASFVGEAALATGQLAFGRDAVNGTESHEPNDVLYVAFTGPDAVPGPGGAGWDAAAPEDFERSVRARCLRVAARIGPARGGNGGEGGSGGGGGGGQDCEWEGHCEGTTPLFPAMFS